MGVVSCCGIGADALWTGLNGPAAESANAGCADFDPEQWFSSKEARQLDRFAQFAVAVADMALADAGELGADPGRSGGRSWAPAWAASRPSRTRSCVFGEKGARRVSPAWCP